LTILKQLRDAAMTCSNADYRAVLKDLANNIQSTIDALHAFPTEDNMIALNGFWARADWALKNVPPEAEPTPPQSSVMEEMRMAA
jgi:hypothetical protein